MTDIAEELDIVAIVPARGGSKRLPRKNIVPLAGKPLIQWTLDAAKASGVIDLIVVTSDDDEVFEIARQDQVTAIRRPEYLASDTATSIDTILHSLEVLAKRNVTAKRVMLLQPTSPLRLSEDICAAVDRMNSTGGNSVISVCEMEHPPLWCNTLPEDGSMDDFLKKELEGRRSQELPVYYRINGAIYLTKCSELIGSKSFLSKMSYSIVMPKERSIDIDCEHDFLMAECILAMKEKAL